MAWAQSMAVRNSNLYENKGIAKPLLTLIALLIISPPVEGEEPHKDAGFCVATQGYLAASLGCSATEVKRWIKVFEADGWIEVMRYRDKLGYNRNRYRLANLDNFKARAMLRDPETNDFVRAKNPNKIRSTSWAQVDTRESLGHGDMEPEGTLIPGPGARCTDPEGTEPRVVGFREFNERVKAEEDSAAAAAHPNFHTSCEQTSGTSSLKPDSTREAGLVAVKKTVVFAAATNNPVSAFDAARLAQAELCAAELESVLGLRKHPEWVGEFLPLLSQDETENFGGPRLRAIMKFALVNWPEGGDDFWLRRTTSAKAFITHVKAGALVAQYEQHRQKPPKPKSRGWAANRPESLNVWEGPHKPNSL